MKRSATTRQSLVLIAMIGVVGQFGLAHPAAGGDIVGEVARVDGAGPDTLSARVFLRGAGMVTARRSGPLVIARQIRDGRVMPPFDVVRLDDTLAVTNLDDVPRLLILFDGDVTHLIGPIAPGGTARRVARRFGPIELSTDAPGSPRSLVFVAENPFVAVAGADGRFRFDGVPPGDYRVVAWRPTGYLGDAMVRVDYEGVIDTGTIRREAR